MCVNLKSERCVQQKILSCHQLVNTNNNEREKHEERERSSESETNSSSTTSSKRLRTFKQVVNIVGKNSKWTRDANKEVQEDQSKSITAKRQTFDV